MCIDLFAIDRAITVRFLHEQIYFEPSHNSLKAYVIVDAFVQNESPKAIDAFRIQLAHYADLADVNPLTESDFRKSYSWIGNYPAGTGSKAERVGFETKLPESTASVPIPAEYKVLNGEIQRVAKTDEQLSAMKDLDCVAFNLVLKDRLVGGDSGWIRLKISTESWPPQESIVPRQGLAFVPGSYDFISRVTFLSPGHLRDRIEHCLTRRADLQGLLVDAGWRKQGGEYGTLTRIQDHRVSFIFPADVDTDEVTNTPKNAFLSFGPTQMESDPGKCLLHFATGSAFNETNDLVSMAKRICKYMEYLQDDGGANQAAKDHLVSRFGGEHHEAVGTLIEMMLRVGIIDYHSKDRSAVVLNAERKDDGLLKLRQAYTFPTSPNPYLEPIRELHPFRIQLKLSWRAFNELQLTRMQAIKKLCAQFETGQQVRPNRRAVVVWCDEYDREGYESIKELNTYADKLCRQLKKTADMDVEQLRNPRTADSIVETLTNIVQTCGQDDLLLFWFLGHGERSRDGQELLLVPSAGVNCEWSRIRSVLFDNKLVNKVVVLDCCHAGLADGQIPDNTLLWMTTGPLDGATAGCSIAGTDDPAQPRNVTFQFASRLESNRVESPLEFTTALEYAQERVSDEFKHKRLTNFTTEPLLIPPQDPSAADRVETIQR